MIILIADDDRLVRFSIKSILGEILGDSGDIFLEARDGEEMVRLCKESQPDIAFVDIRMPRLSGLEAISQSKEYCRHTEYVIVSGYSDFEYAQKGIRLGINEYLLKPVDEEELREVVEKLSEKVKQNKADSNSRFQLKVMDAFNYYSTMGTVMSWDGYGGMDGYGFMVFMLRAKAGQNDWERTADFQRRILEEISALGRNIVQRKGYYAAAGNGYGTPCIIFYVRKDNRDYILSQLSRISAKIYREEMTIHYLVWFEAEKLEDVCVRCEKIEKDLELLIQEKPGAVCRYEDLVRGKKEREFLHLTGKLTDSWAQADGVACREIMNRMWREYKSEKLELNLKNVSDYCSLVTGTKVEYGSLKSFCRSLVENSDHMYDTMRRTDSDVIDQVKDYIQKHYMRDVSISQIAEQFHLTANYLSTIFHQRTGKRFVDYLSETRVEAAKKLLVQNASASVQDIALMVGYNSARHFSSLFQKQTGMTPTAYRKEKCQ